MLFIYFLFTFILKLHWTFADDLHSAIRMPNESFRAAYNRYRERLTEEGRSESIEDSAMNLAKPLLELNVSRIPKFDSKKTLDAIFERVRDERFLKWPRRPHFPRRPSWFYPDDGCYARASMMTQSFERWKLAQIPEKLYIFGKLVVRTKNSPKGSVSWWYHVAPVVRVDNDVFVLDPAISPQEPMPLEKWIRSMVRDPQTVRLSVCNPHTYAPASICENPPPDTDAPAITAQLRFLDAEWSRLLQLGRDPEEELGDTPTWLLANKH